MKDTRLLKILNETKDVLCRYDYYIHTAKRILHLTNSELKIPHLMGLQYVGRPSQYERDYDILYRNLTHSYEITKIVRENKETKQAETIYPSEQASLREKTGIEKMLANVCIEPNQKLVRYIMKINVKFGKYHTVEMLSDSSRLLGECRDKRDEALVKDFMELWGNRTSKT